MGSEDCCATQLIDGNGQFNERGLEHFVRTVKLADCGLSYAVVSIMGPQSSGQLLVVHSLELICILVLVLVLAFSLFFFYFGVVIE